MMASAWGGSWGGAWGVAWGAIRAAVSPDPSYAAALQVRRKKRYKKSDALLNLEHSAHDLQGMEPESSARSRMIREREIMLLGGM